MVLSICYLGAIVNVKRAVGVIGVLSLKMESASGGRHPEGMQRFVVGVRPREPTLIRCCQHSRSIRLRRICGFDYYGDGIPPR